MTDSTAAGKTPPAARSRRAARFAPIAVIAFLAAVIFASGAWRYLSLETLREHRAALEAFVGTRLAAALLVYAAIYIAATALSLPGASLLSVTGGFLFGTMLGGAVIVVAATIGAAIIFTAAKTAVGDSLRAKAGPFARRMEEGFRANAFSYLLLLRLIPLFPFFIVNIAPALFNVRTRTFILATFIGIVPGAFAFASAGAGLGAVLDRGGDLQLKGLLLDPAILTPIVALSLLALLPIALKAFGVLPKRRDAA